MCSLSHNNNSNHILEEKIRGNFKKKNRKRKMRVSVREKVESCVSRRMGLETFLARDVREESVNNLACFFVVRTAWAGGWSQSPQCLAWKVLSLERLEHTTSWEPQRQSAAFIRALGTLTLKAISGIKLWRQDKVNWLSFSSFVSVHHVSEVCGNAWNCHANIPLLCVCRLRMCLRLSNET